MTLDTPISMMDSADPFGGNGDFLDMDPCFDSNHNGMMMHTGLSGLDQNMDLGPAMQPTPPSSISNETMTLDDVLSPNRFHHDRTMTGSSSSTSGIGLGVTYGDFNIDPPQSSDIHLSSDMDLRQPPPLVTNLSSTSQVFAPSPELTPSQPAQNPTIRRCTNRCSSTLIQKLACLNEHLSDKSNSSLDTILQVERDTCSLCRRILSCHPCSDDKSNYLLFGMVIDQVVKMLETIPEQTNHKSFTVNVGNFEVDQDTKVNFLKKYLVQRIGELASILKDWAQTVDENAKDYNSNAAREMLRDVYRRLDVLRKSAEI